MSQFNPFALVSLAFDVQNLIAALKPLENSTRIRALVSQSPALIAPFNAIGALWRQVETDFNKAQHGDIFARISALSHISGDLHNLFGNVRAVYANPAITESVKNDPTLGPLIAQISAAFRAVENDAAGLGIK